MNPVALFGAFFGGVVGAVVWSLVAHFTGWDMAFLALVIGGIVGYGAVALDGQGVALALCCVVICLGAIFGGKMGRVYAGMGEVKDEVAAMQTEDRYKQMVEEAPAFARLPSADYYKDFMVENDYTQGSSATDDELEQFGAYIAPVLRRLWAERLNIETWRDYFAECYLEYHLSNHSIASVVLSRLGFADLFFSFLGVVTAFVMVVNAAEAERVRVHTEV